MAPKLFQLAAPFEGRGRRSVSCRIAKGWSHPLLGLVRSWVCPPHLPCPTLLSLHLPSALSSPTCLTWASQAQEAAQRDQRMSMCQPPHLLSHCNPLIAGFGVFMECLKQSWASSRVSGLGKSASDRTLSQQNHMQEVIPLYLAQVKSQRECSFPLGFIH